MDPGLRRIYSQCVEEVDRGTLSKFLEEFDLIVVDLASVTYGVRNRLALVKALSMSGYGGKVLLVLDFSREEHVAAARKILPMIERFCLGYALSRDRPAEILAGELCREKMKEGVRCIVLSRDYDPLQVVDEMLQPIRVHPWQWILRRIRVDRTCLSRMLGDQPSMRSSPVRTSDGHHQDASSRSVSRRDSSSRIG